MTLLRSVLRKATILVLAGAATPALAQAIDANDFAQKFTAAYEGLGYPIEVGAATADGTTVTLSNVKSGIVAPEVVAAAAVQDLVFADVSRDAQGNYRAERLTATDASIEVMGYVLRFENLRAEGLWLPNTVGVLDPVQLVESGSMGPVTLSKDGRTLLSIETVTSNTLFLPLQGGASLESVEFEVAVDGIVLDPSVIEDPDLSAGLSILRNPITGSAREHVTWTLGDGRMIADEVSLTLDGLGRFNATMDFAGYTERYIRNAQALQAQLAASATSRTQSQEELSAQQMALAIAALQGITVNSISVRFEDDSLTDRLVTAVAKHQRLTREQVVMQWKRDVIANIDEAFASTVLAEQLVTALNAFLDDPQSLEFRAAPPTALPIALLLGGPLLAGGDPAQFIAFFGVSIAANR